ncbi:hypothetical protein BT96DRAFT_364457 [Gymnopus androsaceus JB14]|uniref:Uncharacterized protein n=1 Tax=Gymnopus androsaceus JB14 TaxID=1447944 RepID=A0A6A4GWU1_9AGAR|nr:hypothetical protein BT96DRAFT_364457 [Gymnopus androsaceus JB14]
MPFNPPAFYAQQISSAYNGLAIWDPQPGYILNNEDKLTPCPRIRPGDVGYVEETGSFTRLFNIHFPLDDSMQGPAIPEDFEQVERKPNYGSSVRFESANIHHKYKRLKIFGGAKTVPVPTIPVSGSMSFSFERNTSAILGFFDTGVREDSPNMLQTYRDQIKDHGLSWLKAAQMVNAERRVEDIILVTGCTRVRSWVTGVADDESTEGISWHPLREFWRCNYTTWSC